MLWLNRRYEGSPHSREAIQNRFETLFMGNGGAAEMLLIEQFHTPLVSTLWIRLPDTRFRSAFPELNEADEADLPRKAALLTGHNEEFEKLFEYGQEN
jgi:hypothetical protein